MRRLLVFLFFALIYTPMAIFAQEPAPFKPEGKPEIRIFTNFHSTFTDGKNINQFEITRAYLGYSWNFSPTLSTKILLDVGRPVGSNFHMTAFLKNGYLQYKKDKFTLMGGMIPTKQYEIHEQKWGNRYLFKSFQDEYGIGPSADIGISADYQFGNNISADFSLLNGEGFRQLDMDSTLKAGIGMTFNLTNALLFRGYYEAMKKGNNNQHGFTLLASYENKSFNVNGEYSKLFNHSYINGQNFGGYSVFGNLFLKHRMKIFARLDILNYDTVEINNSLWNQHSDTNIFIAGFEFSPVNGIRISPNIQHWQPKKSENPSITNLFLSIELKI